MTEPGTQGGGITDEAKSFEVVDGVASYALLKFADKSYFRFFIMVLC